MSKVIMGVQIEQRHKEAIKVQNMFTEYGCYIKTRLGLHSASDNREVCSEDGLVILEFINGAEKEAAELESKLEAIEGVNVRKMTF